MSEPTTIRVAALGVELVLRTDPALFSPRFLDPGTAALLELAGLRPEDKVLDLGCGYGAVGLIAARLCGPQRVWMVDHDPRATALARQNAETNGLGGVHVLVSDGVASVPEKDFTLILCNPPYHEDWAVPRRFIRKGFNRLVQGGRMALVVKRADWYRQQLTGAFGGCRATERGGYTVLVAEKRRGTWADADREGKAPRGPGTPA